MASAAGTDLEPRGRRPAQRAAIALAIALLVLAVFAVLVALTVAAGDARSDRAPWARPGAPDVRPQPLDEQ